MTWLGKTLLLLRLVPHTLSALQLSTITGSMQLGKQLILYQHMHKVKKKVIGNHFPVYKNTIQQLHLPSIEYGREKSCYSVNYAKRQITMRDESVSPSTRRCFCSGKITGRYVPQPLSSSMNISNVVVFRRVCRKLTRHIVLTFAGGASVSFPGADCVKGSMTSIGLH